MLTRTAVAICLSLGIAACRGAPSPPSPTTPPSPAPLDFAKRITGPATPVLQFRLLAPIVEAHGLTANEYGFEYTLADWRGAAGEPFPNADLAAAEVRRWLTAHFGELPDDTSLVVTSAQPSASGDDEPRDASDRGHTLVLQQHWRGAPTDGYVVAYLRGQTLVSANGALRALEPVAGSERATVTPEGVVAIVLQMSRSNGEDPAELERLREELAPRLEYVQSIRAFVEFRDEDVLLPNWAVAPGATFYVDAHTGAVWRNG